MKYFKSITGRHAPQTDAYGGVMGLLKARGGLATQHVLHADSTTSELHTAANLEGRASMLRIIRFVRTLPGCEKAYIAKMQPETAHPVKPTVLMGCTRLRTKIMSMEKIFEIRCPIHIIRLIYMWKKGLSPNIYRKALWLTVPLRALIPKGSKNLLVAGRCVSSDRLANSALRVQASCMGMGQAAGATAALAYKKNMTPADVPIDEIKQLIRNHGGIVPA